MSSKKSLGIFWDIENVVIPPLKSPSGVVKRIRDFIADRHPECGFPKEFNIVCDTNRIDTPTKQSLNKSDVAIVYVDGCAKNGADDKLMDQMDKFVQKYESDSLIVVITSDTNFSRAITSARRRDAVVVLIHNVECSPELKHLASVNYLFHDIIRNVENVNKNVNPLTTVHLIVTDLPKDKTNKQIIDRLSQLSSSNGGKVINVFNGQAVIRFRCKDDALRCQQRQSGADCFGHKIRIQLFESPNPPVLRSPEEYKRRFRVGNNNMNQNREKYRNLGQNKWKNMSKSETNLSQIGNNSNNNYYNNESTENNGCKCVIRKLWTRLGEDVDQTIRERVAKWGDNRIHPNMIKEVKRLNRKGMGDGRATLLVTAISAQVCQTLLDASRRHLNDGEWDIYKPRQPPNTTTGMGQLSQNKPSFTEPTRVINNKPNENPNYISDMSVIKGFETKSDGNFTEDVKNIVRKWKDSLFDPDYISEVTRNSKHNGKDGTFILYVKAISAEKNKILRKGAKKYQHMHPNMKWTKYQQKQKDSSSDDDDDDIGSGTISKLLASEKLSPDLYTPPVPKPRYSNMTGGVKMNKINPTKPKEDCTPTNMASGIDMDRSNVMKTMDSMLTNMESLFKISPSNTSLSPNMASGNTKDRSSALSSKYPNMPPNMVFGNSKDRSSVIASGYSNMPPNMACGNTKDRSSALTSGYSNMPPNMASGNNKDRSSALVSGYPNMPQNMAFGNTKDEMPINVFIKLSSPAKTIVVSITVSDTVLTLKRRVQEKEGIDLGNMVLTLKGKPLKDNQLLSDYGVKKYDLFFVSRQFLSGAKYF